MLHLARQSLKQITKPNFISPISRFQPHTNTNYNNLNVNGDIKISQLEYPHIPITYIPKVPLYSFKDELKIANQINQQAGTDSPPSKLNTTTKFMDNFKGIASKTRAKASKTLSTTKAYIQELKTNLYDHYNKAQEALNQYAEVIKKITPAVEEGAKNIQSGIKKYFESKLDKNEVSQSLIDLTRHIITQLFFTLVNVKVKLGVDIQKIYKEATVESAQKSYIYADMTSQLIKKYSSLFSEELSNALIQEVIRNKDKIFFYNFQNIMIFIHEFSHLFFAYEGKYLIDHVVIGKKNIFNPMGGYIKIEESSFNGNFDDFQKYTKILLSGGIGEQKLYKTSQNKELPLHISSDINQITTYYYNLLKISGISNYISDSMAQNLYKALIISTIKEIGQSLSKNETFFLEAFKALMTNEHKISSFTKPTHYQLSHDVTKQVYAKTVDQKIEPEIQNKKHSPRKSTLDIYHKKVPISVKKILYKAYNNSVAQKVNIALDIITNLIQNNLIKALIVFIGSKDKISEKQLKAIQLLSAIMAIIIVWKLEILFSNFHKKTPEKKSTSQESEVFNYTKSFLEKLDYFPLASLLFKGVNKMYEYFTALLAMFKEKSPQYFPQIEQKLEEVFNNLKSKNMDEVIENLNEV